MAHMDHKQAIDLQLAVKYVLGELPPVQRDEYEDHYMDCPECARDVHAAAAFADTAREVFRQEARNEAPARDQHRAGWFAWLRPMVAVPAFAVLLLALGYQSLVTIPRAKEKAASREAQVLFNSHPLRGVNTAGGEGRTLSIHAGEAFLLNFDFVPTRSFENYICQIEDAQGHAVLRAKIAGANANQEAHLAIPAGALHAGQYVLAFYGNPSDSGKVNPLNGAGRLTFMVEFSP
jgi:hypothetical protein